MLYVTNCEEFHHEMARKLQKTNPKKCVKAKEKAKDTCEQKKQVAELAEGTKGEQSEDEVYLVIWYQLISQCICKCWLSI